MPPELTEEEELAVAVLISQEEERRALLRAFPELADALVLSVAPHHRLGHRRCSRRALRWLGHVERPGPLVGKGL
jgi:hypothetical protein